MYYLDPTTKFKKDLKKIKKNTKDFELVRVVLRTLQEKGVSGISQKMNYILGI